MKVYAKPIEIVSYTKSNGEINPIRRVITRDIEEQAQSFFITMPPAI
jgi:hypothetical protein